MSKQEYSKLTHEEHVLKIPDTYIGDIEQNIISSWYFCNDTAWCDSPTCRRKSYCYNTWCSFL